MPGLPDGGDVVCDLVADHFQCTNLQSQTRKSIPANDVVCVLPDSEQGQSRYRLLYLRQAQGDSILESIRVVSIPPTVLSTYLVVRNTPQHLQPPSTHTHVILSTQSGTGQGRKLFHRVLQPFLSHLRLDDYQLHETQSTQTITELARSIFLPRALEGVSQTIILLSGDGGLVDIIDVFHSSAPVGGSLAMPNIALIPTGTGNAMANSTGLLTYPKSPLVALVRGKTVPIPAFSVSFSPGAQLVVDEGRDRAPLGDNPATGPERKVHGAVVASWGIHAALVADSDTAEYRRFGVDRFKMAAKELLYPSNGAETHRYKGTISLSKRNGQIVETRMETMGHREHMYTLATFVSNLERNFMISPSSLPLDGQLRMVHFPPVSPEEAMRLLGLAYQDGRHVHDPVVTYAEVEGFRVVLQEEDEKWRRICIDGKVIVVEEGGWMEVRKEARHLLNLISCSAPLSHGLV